jgi:hypothetical protein
MGERISPLPWVEAAVIKHSVIRTGVVSVWISGRSRSMALLGKPMTHKACPECGSPMEEGFLPDIAHGQVWELGWQRGPAEPARILGISNGVKLAKGNLAVTALRCTRCGFLKLYAKPPSE